MKKIINITKASSTNLDGVCRSTHRLHVFGFHVATWHTAHKSRPSDFQRSTFLGLIFGSCLLLAILNPASAQTNTPAQPPAPTLLPGVNMDWLGFIPAVTNMQQTTVSLETGAASENSVVANYIKLDYYFNPVFLTGAEIQNAPVSTTFENATLYPIGVRKSWANAEVKALIAFRRNFAGDGGVKPSYQVGTLLEANWFPVTGGHVAFNCGLAILSDPENPFGAKPTAEIRAGASVGF